MKFGSLFTGIGGIDLGLERAGMECAWQVEIDDYATKVLERHWPDVPRWRDVWEFIGDANQLHQEGRCSQQHETTERSATGYPCRGFEKRGLGRVDLICGGFPCQPVSVAGRRKGASDERWLWPAFREVIRIVRPRYVLAENVRGLLSAKDAVGRRGGLFGGILGDLSALGYDAEWEVIPAAAFDLPHQRERVFVVAYTASERSYTRGTECEGQQRSTAPFGCGEFAADTDGTGPQEWQGERGDTRPQLATAERADWRTVEPTIRRGVDGISRRVDRLRCLGNAVVPQVVEWIGRRIETHSAI